MKQLLKRLRRLVAPHWTDLWPEQLARANEVRTLHLGSGFSPVAGAMTVDINEKSYPDVQWDLNVFPWPLEESSFDLVIALSILEHLDNFFDVMAEIHRVSAPGAIINILVPHFSSGAAFVDPTHKKFLSARSCDYFICGTAMERDFGFYVPWRFEAVQCLVDLAPGWRLFPGATWLVRYGTALWEDYLCYIIRGAGVFWQLRTVK